MTKIDPVDNRIAWENGWNSNLVSKQCKSSGNGSTDLKVN